MIQTVLIKSTQVLLLITALSLGSTTSIHATELTLTDVLPVYKALDTELKADLDSFTSKVEAQAEPETSVAAEPTPIAFPIDLAVFELPIEKAQDPDEEIIPISVEYVIGVSTKFSHFHPGIDIRAKVGSPIQAIHKGTVIEVAYEAYGYGRYVIVESMIDGKSVRSLYAHMKEANVEIGQAVEAKTILGQVGMTGRTTGPHLHFEVYEDLRAIDPIRFLTKSASKQIAKAK